MNSLIKLALKNLRYYHKTHRLTLTGMSVSVAILVGALVVADSLDHTLVRIAEKRLGRVEFSLDTQDRFVRADLAQAIADSLAIPCTALLSLQATAFSNNNQHLNQISLWGVDEKFWTLAESPPDIADLHENQAVINTALAKRLSLRTGDELVVRFEKKSSLPAELPLARALNTTVALRVIVNSILADESFGRFSLQTMQRVPYNIFLSRSMLARELDLAGLCNVLLVRGPTTLADLQSVLEKKRQLLDLGLIQRPVPQSKQWEWTSRRIFIEDKISAAVTAQPVFTYFVNSLQLDGRLTPYSFVATADHLTSSPQPKDGQMVLTKWLAEDLRALPGDSITLAWFALNERSQLVEHSYRLHVQGIMATAAVPDSTLIPQLPGLADVENCRDWRPGLPLDLKKIRPKDEQYWKTHRGAPKALISVPTAQRLWANRFGNCTGLRFPDAQSAAVAEQQLQKNLALAEFGLTFQPVKQQALQAAGSITDFAQLFIGLSFFVILSALLLIGLLFQMHLDSRHAEMAVYSALGFKRSQIQNLFLLEGALLGLPASVIGPCLGMVYVYIMVLGLRTWWSAAFAMPDLSLHIRIPSLLTAIVTGYLSALLVIFWRCKRLNVVQPFRTRVTLLKSKAWWVGALLTWFGGSVVLVLANRPGRASVSLSFFAAGFLLMAGSLMAGRAWLGRQTLVDLRFLQTTRQLALRNLSRRPGRSLAVITLWAVAVFLILAVGSNRKPVPDTTDRRSGSGGFSLWMESAAALPDDLNNIAVRKKYGIADSTWQHVTFFSMRLRSGQDASCLNLNRSLQPPLLGIDALRLDSLQAFTFVNTVADIQHPWQGLATDETETVPAIADQTVLQWGLGKAVGDTLIFVNESGRRFNVRLIAGLANSVFQGHLLISQKALLRHYPSQPGYRLFLIAAPANLREKLADRLRDALTDLGVEVTTTAKKLAQFNEIENTYLSIFLMLGGLALLLGSVGMGIVAVRNIHEQRTELAALSAIGFSQRLIGKILIVEHGILFLIGLLIGAVAAILGLLPLIKNQESDFPLTSVSALLALIVIGGLVCIRYAVRRNLDKNISALLKNE